MADFNKRTAGQREQMLPDAENEGIYDDDIVNE